MDYITLTILFIILAIGSIQDIRMREVANTLNFSLIAIGMTLGLIYTVYFANIFHLLNAIAGFLVAYIIGIILYETGQWGGGDAKMIWGIGTMLGINLPHTFSTIPPILKFIILSLIVGALYGLIYIIVKGIIHRKEIKEIATKNNELQRNPKIRNLLLFTSIIAIILTIIFPIQLQIRILIYALIVIANLTFYLHKFTKIVEQVVLVKEVKIDDLTEGEWIEYIPHQKGGKNVTLTIDRTGITKEEIQQLKNANIKYVIVKNGIPFIPSFLITLIVYLII